MGPFRFGCHSSPRRAAFWFSLTLLICVGAVSSSPAVAGAPTLASWDKAADAACNAANVAIDKLPAITSVAIELDDLHTLISIGDRENAAVTAIPKPAAQAKTIKRLIALEEEGTTIAHKLITAVDDDNVSAVKSEDTEDAKLDDDYNALAISLHARTCAVNPEPGSAPSSKTSSTTTATTTASSPALAA